MVPWIFIWLLAATPASGDPAADPQVTDARDRAAPSLSGSRPSDVTPAASSKSPRQLRAAIHEALCETAKPGPGRAAAIRRLVDLHADLLDDTQMLDEDRSTLERVVRARLKKLSGELKQAAAKRSATDGSPVASRPPVKLRAPANASPASQIQAPGGGDVDEGEALVELIESTIFPPSWERNGGLGTIRYFAPAQAIVVRQTDVAHDNLHELVEALRK
jgi:hypothetical protein